MSTAGLVLALTALAGLTAMQVLLIRGVPIGRFAWGGQHDVLPPRLRTAAVVAILLYAGFATLLLSRAGVLPGQQATAVAVATWALVAYSAASILLNLASRSRAERIVQTPVSVVLTAGMLAVALAPTG